MACEVAEARYLCPTWPGLAFHAHTERVVPFMHNYIHDLESLWWLGVYTILRHTIDGVSRRTYPYDINDHFAQFDALFTTLAAGEQRRSGAFNSSMSQVWSSVPPAFAQFISALDEVHAYLRQAYAIAELRLFDKDPEIDTNAFEHLHVAVGKLLAKADSPLWPYTAQPLLEDVIEAEAKARKEEQKKRVTKRMDEMERRVRYLKL